MRLIDIEAEVCADCVCRDKCDRQAYCWAKAMQTVDAVPVVRCRECKHHYDCGVHFCNRLGMDCPDDSDFFCSYGERNEGAEC
jgi:hypothetical protein